MRPHCALDGGSARGETAVDALHWEANSQLQQVTPSGELVAQYISECAGDPLNYNPLSHECRVDASAAKGADARGRGADGARVLTTRARGKRAPATKLDVRDAPSGNVDIKMEDTFYGSEIVAWDRETNVIEPLRDD